MRKTIITLLLIAPLLVLSPRSYCQTKDSSKYYKEREDEEDGQPEQKAPKQKNLKSGWGVEGGVNFANLKTGSNWADKTVKYRIGWVADFPLGEQVSIRTGLADMVNGAENVHASSRVTGGHSWDISTFEVPLYLLLKSGKPRQDRVYVGFGVTGWYITSQKVDPDDLSHDIKTVNISAGLTAGLESKTGFFVNVRADWGMTNLADGSNEFGTSIHSSDFLIQIGIIFKEKKKHRKSHGVDAHMGKVW